MKNQKVIEILVEFALFGGLKVDTEGYLEAGAISWLVLLDFGRRWSQC